MKQVWFAIIALFVALVPSARADDFANSVDLSPLQTLAVQHQQTVKTLDSYARQTLSVITGSGSLDGRPALFTVLDMAIRPDLYRGRNLIKIKNVPVRKEFLRLSSISADEQERIVHDGTVSLKFWMQDDVQQMLQELQSTDTRKADAIAQANGAAMLLGDILRDEGGFPPADVIPPAPDNGGNQWHALDDLAGTIPSWADDVRKAGHAPPAALPGYNLATLEPAVNAAVKLIAAWQDQNAAAVSSAAANLAAALPQVNPTDYPSLFQRQVEVQYNRWGKLAIPGASFYFLAFVCFLMGSRSTFGSLRLWGLRLFAIGFVVHTAGIGVRWWLVGSIPIKNEFESVMFSAWFAALVGGILELRSARGLFGAGASFVGWMSLTAICAVPYVFGREIGGEIGQVNGVLMSYWLYIHVTTVTASYAMISMSFLLSAWWLVEYYRGYDKVRDESGARLSGTARGFDIVPAGSGAALSAGLMPTLARMLFIPPSAVPHATAPVGRAAVASPTRKTADFLSSLDACNLVVLQLGFWLLGTGIIFGAIWADESWGRVWAWDPKETFALVTWIAYLVVVHVRVVTEDKGWWTATLSLAGFFIMLFNWIGVNYFLSGLHSYA